MDPRTNPPPPCNITLPALPDDRRCALDAGHPGEHIDRAGHRWSTDRAMHLHQLITDAAATITAQAPKLARSTVLQGTASLQVKGLENRAARRATNAAQARRPRDARFTNR